MLRLFNIYIFLMGKMFKPYFLCGTFLIAKILKL